MRDTEHKTTSHQRLSVRADARLVEDLLAHQREVRQSTGMPVSLTQVVVSLLRRGLDRATTAQT